MAKSFNPRFATPAVLDSLDRTLLCELLRPHTDSLATSGVNVADPASFDPRAFAELVMAGSGLPDGVVDLICLIEELAAPRLYDRVLACARDTGVPVDPDTTIHELVARVMIADRDALLDLRTEDFSRQRKRFDRYMTVLPKLPRQLSRTRARIGELEKSLDDEFIRLHRQRGRGVVRIHGTDEKHGFRLIIRRGDTRRNQPVIDDRDETRSRPLLHRPELYDIVRYDARHGDLLVMAKAKSEVRAYCHLIGLHLFNDRFAFDPALAPRRYSLDPIRDDGAACLERGRIDGVLDLRLDVLGLVPAGHDGTPVTIGPGDVFGVIRALGGTLSRRASLPYAVLKIRLRGERDERRVAIRPPISATYERDDASEIVEEVVERIGLLLPRSESLHGAPQTLFSMS